jgi:hypothetical protein
MLAGRMRGGRDAWEIIGRGFLKYNKMENWNVIFFFQFISDCISYELTYRRIEYKKNGIALISMILGDLNHYSLVFILSNLFVRLLFESDALLIDFF